MSINTVINTIKNRGKMQTSAETIDSKAQEQ